MLGQGNQPTRGGVSPTSVRPSTLSDQDRRQAEAWLQSNSGAWVLLFPPDPAFEAFTRDPSKTYDEHKADLLRRFPTGSGLKSDDPYLRVIQIGGKPVRFYDLGSKFGPEHGMLWWKEGVGWVKLLDEAPPGMPASFSAWYREKVASRFRPIRGQSAQSPVAGRGSATKDVYGGGMQLSNGSRVYQNGFDQYPDGSKVWYQMMVYDPRTRQWTFTGLQGITKDGRRWTADVGFYKDGRPVFLTKGKPGMNFTGSSAGQPGAPTPQGGKGDDATPSGSIASAGGGTSSGVTGSSGTSGSSDTSTTSPTSDTSATTATSTSTSTSGEGANAASGAGFGL